jgi:hypothetical protein
MAETSIQGITHSAAQQSRDFAEILLIEEGIFPIRRAA